MGKMNQESYDNLRSLLTFESISFIGRTFKKNKGKLPLNQNPILVDFGAGENFKDGWIHVDFYSFRLQFWKGQIKKRRCAEVELDLRYPLNWPSDIVDGVYTSHTLEHLTPNDAKNLLKEIHRVLKPGSYLRIIVPDIEIAVNFYTGKNKDLVFETGCEAIWSFTQNWGHVSTWDTIFLSKILKEVGFSEVKKVEFGVEGVDKRLIKDPKNRKNESMVLEALK
jgi:SAM-dependent methyltransferase